MTHHYLCNLLLRGAGPAILGEWHIRQPTHNTQQECGTHTSSSGEGGVARSWLPFTESRPPLHTKLVTTPMSDTAAFLADVARDLEWVETVAIVTRAQWQVCMTGCSDYRCSITFLNPIDVTHLSRTDNTQVVS